MRVSELTRFLGPAGWLVVGVVVFVAALIAMGALGFRFDPFDFAERRADRAEGVATHAQSDASARHIEAAGADDTRVRTEAAQNRISDARAVAAAHSQEVPDEDPLLDPAAFDRLRRVDEQLCAISGVVCSISGRSAAEAVHAGDGESGLHAADPAA